MALSSTDWTALGSIFTAAAAFVALVVGVVPYRQQNRMARATALRGVVRTVLHDSEDIYDLTVYASSVIPDAQIRAFRRQLGETATVGDFQRYFFAEHAALAATSFIEASLDSSAYSRLSMIWNDIDRASAELHGSLRILYDAATLIIKDSQEICFPDTSIIIAHQMADDHELMEKCQSIDNIDTLTLVLSKELSARLHSEPYENVINRLDYARSFVEIIAGAVRDMKDHSLRSLASESLSSWSDFLAYEDWSEFLASEGTPAIGRAHEDTPTDDSVRLNLDNIDRLMIRVKPKIPKKSANDLQAQFIKWQKAYVDHS